MRICAGERVDVTGEDTDREKWGSAAWSRRVLREAGLAASRSRGQNFLSDERVLRKIVEAAEIRPEEGAVEIGAGLGVLTRALASVARHVCAFEVDRGLHELLTGRLLADLKNVTVLHADVLKADLREVVPRVLGPGRLPVVANIPYNLSSPLIVRLLAEPGLFSRLVLMVQEEFAGRLLATPGTPAYGSLTLYVHRLAEVRRVLLVSRACFVPRPGVDSTVVRLDLRPEPLFPGVSPEGYNKIVRSAFQQRRKTLLNALAGPPLGWSKAQAQEVLRAAGIDPARRGETLAPEEFAALAARAEPPAGSAPADATETRD